MKLKGMRYLLDIPPWFTVTTEGSITQKGISSVKEAMKDLETEKTDREPHTRIDDIMFGSFIHF